MQASTHGTQSLQSRAFPNELGFNAESVHIERFDKAHAISVDEKELIKKSAREHAQKHHLVTSIYQAYRGLNLKSNFKSQASKQQSTKNTSAADSPL